jgi:hypothetical protein
MFAKDDKLESKTCEDLYEKIGEKAGFEFIHVSCKTHVLKTCF